MAWVDLPTARAEADRPLDSGTCTAIHSRLTQIYTQSCFDICVPLAYPGTSLDGATTTTEWQWIGHPLPVLARPRAGGAPRTIIVEVAGKGSTSDEWYLRAYLLATRVPPALDDTDAVLDSTAYGSTSFDDTAYGYASMTITPDASDVMAGDGLISGYAQPVYWLHLCHKGLAAITIHIIDLRIRESVA